MRQVIHDLEVLRRRSRLLLVLQRVSVVVAAILAVMLALVLLDYMLRLPSAVRMVLLLAGVTAIGWSIWFYVRSAVRFWPSLTELALRVERTVPRVAGRLASSVEFVQGHVDEANPLAARAVKETDQRLMGESFVRTVMKPRRTVRDLGALTLIAAVAVTLVLADTETAATGVKRLLVPYGASEWPARSGVESLMDQVLVRQGVHRRGQALPLRARVTRGADDQRVDAHYRLRVDGSFERWTRIVLTHQDGGIHERLIDTGAEAVEFYFETEDARTSIERIALVPAPGVERASLRVAPPAYASGRFPLYEAELGPGLDERAVTDTASLMGSDVELRLELNKAIPVPTDDRDAWLRATLAWGEGALPELTIDDGPSSDAGRLWHLRWQLDQTRSLRLHLADEYGMVNAEPIAYRIEAAEDRLPSVTIAEPESDQVVLPTAMVALKAEAHDDVAVARIGLEASIERPDDGALEVVGVDADVHDVDDADPAAAPPVWTTDETVDAVSADLGAAIDLSTLDLQESDVVLVTALAEDMYEADGTRHPSVRSPPRRLRVISELEFATQLRRQLGAVRQNAIRIEAIQAELQDDVIDNGLQPGLDRAQAQIGERVAAQREVIDEVEQQLRDNRMDDEPLLELILQTRDGLDLAGRAANRAVEAIEARAQQQQERRDRSESGADRGGRAGAGERETAANGASPDGDRRRDDAAAADADEGRPDEPLLPEMREPAEADRDIVDNQQEVRDELANLIELLDRDEDAWVVTRKLEGLLEEQTRLRTATEALGQRTVGLSPEDLSDADRRELERIEARQEELRDDTRRAVEDLRRRESTTDADDPESAAAMGRAADTAERDELDRDMDSAAQQVGQNQMRAAGSNQASAIQTLQRMLEDIQEGKRARAEELLRKLASLIESIDRLIIAQEQELESLAGARLGGNFTGRDRAMIRLNQNTLAVAGEARAAGQQTRQIARTLDRAADAQGAAVASLRRVPPDVDGTERGEERSLELLREAKRLAEELQKQTADDEVRRRREALIQAYRMFAEQQRTLRGESAALAELEILERRHLVEARQQGNRQDEIRAGLDELRDITQELMSTIVFTHAHRLIDEWSEAASAALFEGRVDIEVTDRQQWIAEALDRLVVALEESFTPPDEFAQDSQSGQGGPPGQQPLIPPVAELKLLHGLQEQVYNQTQDLDGREDLLPAQQRGRLRDLGRQQRDLMDLGQQMLEQIQSSQPAPGAPRE